VRVEEFSNGVSVAILGGGEGIVVSDCEGFHVEMSHTKVTDKLVLLVIGTGEMEFGESVKIWWSRLDVVHGVGLVIEGCEDESEDVELPFFVLVDGKFWCVIILHGTNVTDTADLFGLVVVYAQFPVEFTGGYLPIVTEKETLGRDQFVNGPSGFVAESSQFGRKVFGFLRHCDFQWVHAANRIRGLS